MQSFYVQMWFSTWSWLLLKGVVALGALGKCSKLDFRPNQHLRGNPLHRLGMSIRTLVACASTCMLLNGSFWLAGASSKLAAADRTDSRHSPLTRTSWRSLCSVTVWQRQLRKRWLILWCQLASSHYIYYVYELLNLWIMDAIGTSTFVYDPLSRGSFCYGPESLVHFKEVSVIGLIEVQCWITHC